MNKRVLVTGGSSTIGRHLKDIMPDATYITSNDYDLRDSFDARRCLYHDLDSYDVVIHLAAVVGGIQDNISNPLKYFDDNILMNTNIVRESYKFSVKRFIGVLSTCIYPDKVSDNEYPMPENYIYKGIPAETNRGYGYAKRMLGYHIDLVRETKKYDYSYITPCNMYSEYDNFYNEKKAHFITALLKKIKLADYNGDSYIKLLGTGIPRRQFVYAGDVAHIIKQCIDNNIYENFNIIDEDLCGTIHELAYRTIDALNLNLKVTYIFDTPDGQICKDVSNSRFRELFPDYKFAHYDSLVRDIYDKIDINS